MIYNNSNQIEPKPLPAASVCTDNPRNGRVCTDNPHKSSEMNFKPTPPRFTNHMYQYTINENEEGFTSEAYRRYSKLGAPCHQAKMTSYRVQNPTTKSQKLRRLQTTSASANRLKSNESLHPQKLHNLRPHDRLKTECQSRLHPPSRLPKN